MYKGTWIKLRSTDISLELYKQTTLVCRIVDHVEIKEYLTKFSEKLIVERLFYTISSATNKRTRVTFSHCVKSQTRLTMGLLSDT